MGDVGLIAISANGANLSPSLVKSCILQCARVGRECTEIYMADYQLRQEDSCIKTLAGVPLHGVPDIEHGSLLFCDEQGTVVELHDLATPVLPSIVEICESRAIGQVGDVGMTYEEYLSACPTRGWMRTDLFGGLKPTPLSREEYEKLRRTQELLSTPAGTRSQPALTTRALPSPQDVPPEKLG